jgi:hypothetical protein
MSHRNQVVPSSSEIFQKKISIAASDIHVSQKLHLALKTSDNKDVPAP